MKLINSLQLARMRADASWSAAVAGLLAVIISYAGPLLIIVQAAQTAALGQAELSSWIWAISCSSGLTAIILSLRYKIPVVTAWSTPGAVLLAAGWTAYSYQEAIGAFVLAGILAALLGLSGWFSRAMQRIPHAIISAMLAGILLKFGVDVFVAIGSLPAVTAPMLLVYVALKRRWPRYAVIGCLLVGIVVYGQLHDIAWRQVEYSLVAPVLTLPTFSLAAAFGLALPLFIVAMTAQNATGLAVLEVDGYRAPANVLVTVTGLASVLFAPFGSHGINLAAITAAICTGREAHAEPSRRYMAGVFCGLSYLLLSVLGATVTSLFALFPREWIAVVTGLALLGSIQTSLAGAMAVAQDRDSALVTLLVTVSGISVAGIGAAFWGLLAGLAVSYLWRSPATEPAEELATAECIPEKTI